MKRHHSKQIIVKTKTAGQLLNYHYEIQEKINAGSYEIWKDESWINNFYSLYGKTIEKLIADVRELNQQYYICHKGNLVYDNENKPTLIEGLKFEDYNEKLQPLLQKQIVLR